MAAGTVRTAIPARALNDETPTWCPDRRRLFWVNIREPALHVFDPATGRDEGWVMPAWIGSYGLTDRGAVVALRTGHTIKATQESHWHEKGSKLGT